MKPKSPLDPEEKPGSTFPRRVFSAIPLDLLLARSTDSLQSIQLDEPSLIFAGDSACPDPRTGLSVYGPFRDAQSGKIGPINIGIIGDEEAIRGALSLLHRLSRPIPAEALNDRIPHPAFPGLNSRTSLGADLVIRPEWMKPVTEEEIQRILDGPGGNTQCNAARQSYGKRMEELRSLGAKPDIVIGVAPEGLPRSLLLAACAGSIPLHVISGVAGLQKNGDCDEATLAWDISTKLLYKAGNIPWRLAGATGDTCFAGIFARRESGESGTHQWTSYARVLNDFGCGCLVRGDTFGWNPQDNNDETPHLETECAAKLVNHILAVHEARAGRPAGKVLLHKCSRYTEEERLGLKSSLEGIPQHALLSIERRGIQFFRPGQNPVLRGTAIPFDEKLGIIHTNGYVPFLNCYPGTRVLEPLEITENWGALGFEEVASDLLKLTKLDWRTSDFHAKLPVTLDDPAEAYEILRLLGRDTFVLDDRYFL